MRAAIAIMISTVFYLFDGLAFAQVVSFPNAPVSSETVADILKQVGTLNAQDSSMKLLEIIKGRYQIEPHASWGHQVNLAGEHVRIWNSQRKFCLRAINAIVYSSEDGSGKNSSDKELVITDGNRRVTLNSHLLNSSSPPIGYDAWFLDNDGIVLMQYSNSKVASISLLDLNGKVSWSLPISTYAPGRSEKLDTMSVEIVANKAQIGLFVSGQTEHSVYIIDTLEGKIDLWWSTEMYRGSRFNGN